VVTKESLHDRSKADVFTKIFAIVQCTWLVIQSITRASIGLPITQLELVTMAYVVCAVVMYGFWWYKPFGVEHVTTVPGFKGDPEDLKPRWTRIPLVNRGQCHNLLGCIAVCTSRYRRGVYCNRKHGS
jgi:hypothetical protein